ncbi:MAG: hypothetical protein IJT51_09090 [Bacteroidales bacterium]|nr:hypothetical protein [Bacteroidales bacterium]
MPTFIHTNSPFHTVSLAGAAARYYNSDLSIWISVDPLSDKYLTESPYVFCNNNPIKLKDPNGTQPIDPRTGKEIEINLYCAAIWHVFHNTNAYRDDKLYSKADRKILKREFCKPDGVWEGANSYNQKSSLREISSVAYTALDNIMPEEVNSLPVRPPCEGAWRNAAKQGSYIFIDNYWSESLWLKKNINSFNIITVKDNVISQIVNMTKNNGEFNINSVTTFECEFGDIQSRKKSFGLWTEKFRAITVKGTTQKYLNGKPYGHPIYKTYQCEQIL